MIIGEVICFIAMIALCIFIIRKKLKKRKGESKTERGEKSGTGESRKADRAKAVNRGEDHAEKRGASVEAGAAAVDGSYVKTAHKGEESDGIEGYLKSLPELDEDGLPLQVKHEFAKETEENSALCDKGAEELECGRFRDAFGYYRKAALAGSERGMSMCAFLLTVPGLNLSLDEAAVDDVIGWIVELANARRHPFGKGLELLITAVAYPGSTDGMSEEEVDNMVDNARETMETALIYAKDPFAHYLLLLMYAGAVQSIVPEFCEDDDKYAKLLIQTSRFCNEFCFDDNMRSKELSMIFSDKAMFVRGLSCLAEELYAREMYREAFSCYKKAAELFEITGNDLGMAELVCTRCADMYVSGKGIEKDVRAAEKMLEKAADFADTGEPDEYTLYVAGLIEKANKAEKDLAEFVYENERRHSFGIEDIERLTQKLQELSERSAERRKRREEQEEKERAQKEESVPPFTGRLEEVGSSKYFVSNGMYYKVFDVSDDGKEITVDRGYLYGIGRYKIEEKK